MGRKKKEKIEIASTRLNSKRSTKYSDIEYDPKFCERYIRYSSKGLSRYEITKEFGIYMDILKAWEATYPEFAEAVARGKDACRAWWEKIGRQFVKNRKNSRGINTVLWIFNMKNRFDWRDKRDVNQQESKESKIKLDLSDVSDAQLNDLESLPIKNIKKKLKLL